MRSHADQYFDRCTCDAFRANKVTTPCLALPGTAVDLRVSQVADVPNLLVSALLPLDIFM
jgi:acetamidase/formamidase